MLEARLATRLEAKKAQLDALRPLPTAAVARLQEQLLAEWIYHSNAIEGNTLTLPETRFILETGLTVGGKNLREHFEVINHRSAIEYVQHLVQSQTPLTPFEVRQIHALVLQQIDEQAAGQYRTVPVRIGGAAHTPPPPWEVAGLMGSWGEWLVASAETESPVVRAAVAHHKLVAIHAFVDGNGRTARLVMNLLLMQAGYPPAIILQNHRGQYYRMLAQADGGRVAPLVNFVGRAVERSLLLYLEACTPQLVPPSEDEQWISLRQAADGSPYSQAYLSLLARQGRLEAMKKGRNWYTTRRALQEYQSSLP